MNTCSFPKNIEELEYLIDKIKIDFDVTGISMSFKVILTQTY